jgi:hypothetical protein
MFGLLAEQLISRDRETAAPACVRDLSSRRAPSGEP